MRNPEQPLFQVFAGYLVSAFFVRAVGQHFFVGTNGFARLAPPNLCIVIIRQTLFADILVDGSMPLSLNVGWNGQFADWAAFAGFSIEPGVV